MRRHSLLLLALGAVVCATAATAPALAEGPGSEATAHAPIHEAQDTPAQDPSAHDATASVPAARLPMREQACLSGADLREAVSERRVVEPLAAIRAAREAVPRAEIVRVNLCHREGEVLVYVITALRKNGRFVHVTVDSRSGAVDSLQ